MFMDFWPPFNLFQRIAKKMLLAQIKANCSTEDDSSSEDEDCQKDKEERSTTKEKNEGSSEGEGKVSSGKEQKKAVMATTVYCFEN